MLFALKFLHENNFVDNRKLDLNCIKVNIIFIINFLYVKKKLLNKKQRKENIFYLECFEILEKTDKKVYEDINDFGVFIKKILQKRSALNQKSRKIYNL